jgi:hypothetical protein
MSMKRAQAGPPIPGRYHRWCPRSASLVGQHGGEGAPAVILPADQIRKRDPHLVEENLVEVRIARHLPQRTDGDTRRPEIDDEHRQSLVFRGIRVGAGHAQGVVGLLGAGSPHLLTVDDVFVTVPERLCLPARSEPAPGSDSSCVQTSSPRIILATCRFF